ncbi:hypothetical protein D7Y13_30410 [Corallococcus praedator]|uniref:Uncharacterized protein n=1 Tax=Corallococcus praedator TaxID=2316724 RepID=A0ABX9QBX6_9BACT|nr:MULTISPECIES: hypothetical protein [Corallococcus]RKH20000.1 hypothetical protein D7X74_05305 [Corallococcus sp. CA047B]RKH34499.1 hypothetical protein D7X75_07965 [Corallococcus sp. CA031C]RKH96852.1 hypothetical protein D7Y13_30410 [Corallococcus praedator]
MSIRHAVRTLVLAALLGGLPAGATTMLRADLPQMAQASDAVVQGVVRRVQSRWSGDNRRIVTDVEIEVTESLKGTPAGTVLVTQPGGRVGDIGQVVSGLATFSEGEEVVVFLEKKGASAFQLAGMAQGKYQVQRSGSEPRAMAVPASTGDAVLIDPQTRQETVSNAKPVTLAQLKSSIRAALQAQQVAPSKKGTK